MTPNRKGDFLEAIQAAKSSLLSGMAELVSALGRWMEDNPEAVAKLFVWLEENESRQDAEGKSSDRSFFELILPRNWLNLRVGVLQRAQQLMVETGLCLAWAPNAEVIEALVRAPDQESRERELLRHAQFILDDLEKVGTEITSPHLATLKSGLEQAISAYRSGLPMPAQSMAAAVVTTVLESHYGFKYFDQARRAFDEEHPDAAGIWSSRRASIHWALRTAILSKRHRAPHGGFNRHLTAHDVDSGQYDDVNALTGLLLAGGSLRELQEMYWLAERGGTVAYPLRPLAAEQQAVGGPV